MFDLQISPELKEYLNELTPNDEEAILFRCLGNREVRTTRQVLEAL